MSSRTSSRTTSFSRSTAWSGIHLCPVCDVDSADDVTECPACGARLVHVHPGRDSNLGRVLAGRYELRAVLGAGGMGTVYRAWQRSVGREVAIKLVHDSHARDVAWIRRFLREAQLSSRFHHPHTVAILDFGQSDEGDLFLVMELLRGRTLAEVMAQDPRFDLGRTVRVGAQICDALSAAHEQRIVHRDLKPHNVMVLDEPAGRDFVKMLDFGLARSFGDDGESAAADHHTHLVGTPYYMAPELFGGEPASPASDLYALGVVLAEAHLGRPVFASTSPAELEVEKAGLAALPAGIDDRLAGLLRELLDPNPSRRPRQAAAVRERLEASVRPGAVAASRVPARPWRRRVLAGVGVLALAGLVPVVHATLAPTAPPTWCGPAATTYTVVGAAGTTGVRCVHAVREPDGGLGLAWYGEGTRDGKRYRHLGDARVGGVARVIELSGNGEDSARRGGGDLRVRALPDDGALPARIDIDGAFAETWRRAADDVPAYASVFAEPIRACGPHAQRYRVYAGDGVSPGARVRCTAPGFRSWAGSDAVGDGTARLQLGTVDGLEPETYAGIGTGFAQTKPYPAMWLPTRTRYSVRLHALPARDPAAHVVTPNAARIAAWVARANQFLAASGVEVLFVADDDGPDVEPVSDVALAGGRPDDWAVRANRLAGRHPGKIVLFFHPGARDECDVFTSNDYIAMTPDGENTCGVPRADMLAQLIWRHLGLRDAFDPSAPLSPAMQVRLERRLLGRGHE